MFHAVHYLNLVFGCAVFRCFLQMRLCSWLATSSKFYMQDYESTNVRGEIHILEMLHSHKRPARREEARRHIRCSLLSNGANPMALIPFTLHISYVDPTLLHRKLYSLMK